MVDKTLKPNAIVVCCTADWLPLAAVTLLSCAQNGAGMVADYFIVCLDVAHEHRQQLNAFNQLNDIHITLVEAKAEHLASLETGRFSSAALLRFHLDHLISNHYLKLLYLDCDILAQAPVRSIFDENLNSKALAAVEDYQSLPGPLRVFNDHPRAIGLLQSARYFNSGVMLFDWQLTLQQGLLAHCRAMISELAAKGTVLSYPDQDVLNLVCQGRWQPLPLRYNVMSFFVDYFSVQPVFRHYSNQYKPWNETWHPGLAPARQAYARLFKSSPWPDFMTQKFTRVAVAETLACWFRRVDPFSRSRYQRHLSKPWAVS